MSYFLRAGFLTETLNDLEEGLQELDVLLNERDEESGFAELRALLKQRVPAGAAANGSDAQQAWSRIRYAGRLVRSLHEQTQRATAVCRAMPCEPLLFTGAGDSDSVVRVLDRLLAEARQHGEVAAILTNRPPKNNDHGNPAT